MSSRRQRFVMLKSCDEHEFVIPIEAAMQSRMIADMIQGIDQLNSATADLAASGDDAVDDTDGCNGGGGGARGDADGGADSGLSGYSLDNMLEIPLDSISGPVLQLVVHYLVEKESGRNTMSEFRALHSMDPTSESDKQLVLELLLAADYLDC
jgi:hypothetical protein